MPNDADAYLVLSDAELRILASDSAHAIVVDTTRAVLRRAQRTAPSRTGRLRASLRDQVSRDASGDVTGDVTSSLNYARFVHDGTRAHLIRPRHPGGVLRFPAGHGGGIVFARIVHHPGTRAQPFLREALEAVAGEAGFAPGDG